MTGIKNKAEPQEKPSVDYLKNARDIAFVMAVFLYFAGWLYIYFYLGGFGIPLKAVDLDIYNILIYAANVFIFGFNTGKVYLILFLIVVTAVSFFKHISTTIKKLIPLGVILLFPLIFYVSQKAAQHDCKNALIDPAHYLKSIQFMFKDDRNSKTSNEARPVDSTSCKFFMLKQNENENLRLVALSKEEYFVLLPKTGLTEKSYAHYVPIIYIVKKETIELAKITK
uniref:hypothetical protein n=1 Tax=Mucilaginibacter rivuli TaxID=2857527 RepID=UPI001C5EA9E1|nr:hypothetical protein [Mucilaginibacter rivuli]MBW4890334.1 hypothetical protein [Mucilaginibacter rivuli]